MDTPFEWYTFTLYITPFVSYYTHFLFFSRKTEVVTSLRIAYFDSHKQELSIALQNMQVLSFTLPRSFPPSLLYLYTIVFDLNHEVF